MPGLYRCRASASEIAKLFEAETPSDLSWSPMSWPGAPGLVVRAHGDSRRVETMRWGLAPGNAPPGMPSKAAEIATVRDLLAPAAFGHALPTERCLIVVEAFAFPDGDKGARTRTWFGLWDQPLFAWAGLCRRESGKGWGFVGAITTPNALSEGSAVTCRSCWGRPNRRYGCMAASNSFSPSGVPGPPSRCSPNAATNPGQHAPAADAVAGDAVITPLPNIQPTRLAS
nr:SOS response-associated peptidase family protein [Sphingomonas sp. Y57]